MKHAAIIFCILLISGCHSSAPIKKESLPAPTVIGNVLEPVKLKAGGKLVLSRFKAGPQAEDNEQLDELISMLNRGIADSLSEHKTTLSLSDAATTADFELGGYIEEFSKPTKMKQVMGKGRWVFSVSGEIWRKDSGVKVVTFASSVSTDSPKNDPKDTSYRVGRVIGDYICAQTIKE